MARAVGDRRLANEAVTLIDGYVIFMTKTRVRNVSLWPNLTLAIRRNTGRSELDGPARIDVFCAADDRRHRTAP